MSWTLLSWYQFGQLLLLFQSLSVPVRSLSDIADDINRMLENPDKMPESEVEADVIRSSSTFICSKADGEFNYY